MMNTKTYKEFSELGTNALENISGGEGDATRLMYKAGKWVRGAVDATGKFICSYIPGC